MGSGDPEHLVSNAQDGLRVEPQHLLTGAGMEDVQGPPSAGELAWDHCEQQPPVFGELVVRAFGKLDLTIG